MSLDDFYNTFLSRTGEMNVYQYYMKQPGHRDQKLEDYDEAGPEISPKLESYKLLMTIPITGVPFWNKSRLVKVVKIDRSQRYLLLLASFKYRNQIQLTYENRVLDMPSSDCFYHSEKWFILSPFEGSKKIVLR